MLLMKRKLLFFLEKSFGNKEVPSNTELIEL